MSATLRLADLRRHVVAAQGFATRHRRARDADVLACVERLSCVQLDSIATVERSHRIVLATRVGHFEAGATSRLLSQGKLFEYWAHEASLVPVEDWPLFRRRMRERATHHWWGPVIQRDPALARRILAHVRRNGATRADDFAGRSHGMWVLKPEKRMLDALWTAGRLVVVGRDGFVRRYDLPERVVPAELLRAKPPTERAWLRTLAEKAVRARGALTEAGIVDHYRLQAHRAALRRALGGLVRERRLARHEVDDGGAPVYTDAEADPSQAPAWRGATFLSPFDNLLWDRAFVRRAFAFDHVMEIYKPAPQRKWGYYVLPLLVGDRLVGRADLKSERERGELAVRRWHWERGARSEANEEARDVALERLARGLGSTAAP